MIYDYDYKFYLKEADLQGKEHAVKISKVYKTTVYNPTSRKQENRIALSFERRRKDMILNVTQVSAMAQIAGEDEKKWLGVEITLAGVVAYNNKRTIRITAQPSGAAVLFKHVEMAQA